MFSRRHAAGDKGVVGGGNKGKDVMAFRRWGRGVSKGGKAGGEGREELAG